MTGFGAYYAWEQNQAIGEAPDGLGAVQTPAPGFAEDALSKVLAGTMTIAAAQASPTVGIYTPWASQTGDIDWAPTTAQWNLLVAPLTDAQLALARQATFGHPVGWVAVMTTTPVKHELAENAFDSTEYEFFASEAAYRQDDKAAVPKAYFFYWAKLRDDTTGGRGPLAATAKALGGQLVFPMQAPRAGAQRPVPGPFNPLAVTSALAPSPVPGAPTLTTAAAVAKKPSWLALMAVGGAAAVGGWWLVKRRKGKPS